VKNLGALGEAGAVVTNNDDLKQKIQMLRDHGQSRKYHHAVVGWNARMDGFQGAALQIKLRHLAKGNAARRAHAKQYDELLRGVEGVITPMAAPERVHVYHIYAIRVQKRDWVLQTLGARGVSCGIHYPVPVHLQEAYRSLGYERGSFPVAEKCADEFLSLPMFPELAPDQIDYVARQVRAVVAEAKAAK
jgi:dTDP-4-amino-4,6-dideoxygalactose transaminase